MDVLGALYKNYVASNGDDVLGSAIRRALECLTKQFTISVDGV